MRAERGNDKEDNGDEYGHGTIIDIVRGLE